MEGEWIDLGLAVAHHFLVFLLAALLAIELAIVRPGIGAPTLALLGRVDAGYGAAAGLVIVVGICRVLFGLKGWEFYIYNPVFWLKMAAFLAVGLLSAAPTRRIIAWRRRADGVVTNSEIASVRAWLRLEAVFLALVIVFAAAMARGFGY